MPTNEQRREAAKRKLERQLERRAQRARKRQLLTIAGSVLAVVLVAGGVAAVYFVTKGDDSATDTAAACAYPSSPEPAAKPVDPPKADGVEATDDTITASIETNQGNIGLTLDNSKSPCTVNNFYSLASQGYYDNTTCHRIVNGASLKVLQCGDPSATGAGGPGYTFADEYPTPPGGPDPTATQPSDLYKRGVVAMANAGPGTNGSQFFLVFGDSQLPAAYTIFGTVDETGLQTLDRIAANGIAPPPNTPPAPEGSPDPEDGTPKQPVELTSVRMDN